MFQCLLVCLLAGTSVFACCYCFWNERSGEPEGGRGGGAAKVTDWLWNIVESASSPWCIGNHSLANYLKLTVELGVTVHVTVFPAATDEWAGGVDARLLLTIEFSFKLLPINFSPSLSRRANEHVTRFRDFCVTDSAFKWVVWWYLCL